MSGKKYTMAIDALTGLLHDLTDEEILALTDSGNRPSLKKFLAERAAQMWHPISYDQSVGLVSLIERAVGKRNLCNINRDIIPERFKLAGTGVRSVKCRVEAYLDDETSEQAAKRLTDAGHILGNTSDLAVFLHDHPAEVEKWNGWVIAISEESRWTSPVGYVLVPYASVNGACRYFRLRDFRSQLIFNYGVLVISE